MSDNKRTKETKRPKRIPVGTQRDVLNVEGLPDNVVGRIVNDVGGRIQKFLAAGYVFVEPKDVVLVGTRTAARNPETKYGSVVAIDVGQGVTGYLMAIPKEFYEEDQAEKMDRVDENERDMYRQLNSEADGSYGEVGIIK